ncbi:MAG: hypothetical protein ACYTDT_13360 [Planctomycetota bacterium]
MQINVAGIVKRCAAAVAALMVASAAASDIPAHLADARQLAAEIQAEQANGTLVDGNFNVVGHTWSVPTSDYQSNTDSWLSSLHSRLKRQEVREMVIGRLPTTP